MSNLPPDHAGVEQRAQHIAPAVDLHQVTNVLAAQRDAILASWLEATTHQPFHAGRRERAVADHIPRLFDALVALLERTGAGSAAQVPALDDPLVLAAAQDHARARFEQGLQPTDVVTEFRLLRQELGRALWAHLRDTVPASDVVGAELLVHDALDGAITLALHALTTHVEEVREDFLATTIHDTLQPLATIKGFLQFIARGLARPDLERDRLQDYLGRASAEVDRMAELLNTLAEASRVTLGRLTLRVAAVDLMDLVRAAVDRLPPDLGQRIRLELPRADGTRGDWDAAMLDRVISNLLSNALKYSPEGSPIDVAIEAEPDWVHLVVRDYGMGLESEDLAWLFRRYGRRRGARQGDVAGFGLGLYLAYGIAEAHGGRLWAESAGPGQGTTMHLRLPRSVPPPPGEHEPPQDIMRG